MPDKAPEFTEWVMEQLRERRWSQNELARRAGIDSGQMSRVLWERKPGLKVCQAVAEAFGVPVEMVLRLAGHAPQPPGYSPELDEWNSLIEGVDPETVYTWIAAIRAMREGSRRGRQRSPRGKRGTGA